MARGEETTSSKEGGCDARRELHASARVRKATRRDHVEHSAPAKTSPISPPRLLAHHEYGGRAKNMLPSRGIEPRPHRRLLVRAMYPSHFFLLVIVGREGDDGCAYLDHNGFNDRLIEVLIHNHWSEFLTRRASGRLLLAGAVVCCVVQPWKRSCLISPSARLPLRLSSMSGPLIPFFWRAGASYLFDIAFARDTAKLRSLPAV